jgi:predicted nicotinamide N-methyase
MLAIPLEMQTIQLESLELRLLVPEPRWVEAQFRARQEAGAKPELPYWSRIWAAALVLSDYLLRHSQLLRGKRVLELAAGLGMPGLLAARFADAVCVSDYLPEAVEVLQENIGHFGLRNVQAALFDWNALPEDISADVVLLSDINYEPAVFEQLLVVIRRFLATGAVVLLATPQRLMAAPFIAALEAFPHHREDCIRDGVPVTILELRGGADPLR